MCGQINRYFNEVKNPVASCSARRDSESIMEFCYKVNIKGAIARKEAEIIRSMVCNGHTLLAFHQQQVNIPIPVWLPTL